MTIVEDEDFGPLLVSQIKENPLSVVGVKTHEGGWDKVWTADILIIDNEDLKMSWDDLWMLLNKGEIAVTLSNCRRIVRARRVFVFARTNVEEWPGFKDQPEKARNYFKSLYNNETKNVKPNSMFN